MCGAACKISDKSAPNVYNRKGPFQGLGKIQQHLASLCLVLQDLSELSLEILYVFSV